MAGHAATAWGVAGPPTLRLREFDGYFDELLRDPASSTIPNGRVRHELLHVLIRYYQLHVEQMGEIRSLDILSEVLS
jgi:DNA repair protein RecO (recombination protein O)